MGTAPSDNSAQASSTFECATESTSLLSSNDSSLVVSTNLDEDAENDRTAVKCPTCHGTGTIHRRESDQLIALIPYKDKRLKPRRGPILYVAITVIVCLIAGGLLAFFLLPRSVTMEVKMPSIVAHTPYEGQTAMNVTVTFKLELTNNNFLQTHLTDLTVHVMQSSVSVGEFRLNETSVDMLATQTLHCTSQLTFRGNHAVNIKKLCDGDYRHHSMAVIFQSDATYQYLSETEEISHYSYFQLYCVMPTGMMPTP